MSVPQIGFPGSTTAQPQAYGVQPQGYGAQPQPGAEWAQAAQYTMATGQLPPGVTPEMIQGELHAAQEQMADLQGTREEMAMRGQYDQAQQSMKLSGMMGASVKNAAERLGDAASAIGNTPVGGDPDDDKTPDDPDTPTATTSTTASTSAVDTGTADKMNPANFQAGMDQHMEYMPADPMTTFGSIPQSPTGGFPAMPPSPAGGVPAMPQSPMAHLGVQTVAPQTSAHFGNVPMGAQQSVPAY